MSLSVVWELSRSTCRASTRDWAFRTPTRQALRRKERTPCRHAAAVDTGAPLCSAAVSSEVSSRGSAAAAQPPAEPSQQDDGRDFAVAMARLAHETKAEDISVLHVAPLVYWTSYMVFISVFSRPQLGAVLGKMEKEAAERWDRHLKEGAHPSRGEWELLDFGDVVVHCFTPQQREFYDLEAFYGAAEEVDLPFLREGVAQVTQDEAAWAKQL